MRSSATLLLMFSLSTEGCTTAEKESTSSAPIAENAVKSEVAIEKIAVPAKNVTPLADECPPKETVCTMNYAPVVCSAATYGGQAQSSALRLMVWASNGCSGRLRLNKEACKRKLVPSMLGSVQCVPDASGGHCPVSDAHCKDDGKPVTCTASSYDGHVLSEDQRIIVNGSNECRAKVELQMAACRANLDPTHLGGVECHSVSGNL